MSKVTFKHILYRPFPSVKNIREVLDITDGSGFMIDPEEKIRIGDYYPVTNKSKEKYRYMN